MRLKQISVFLENRTGALGEATAALEQANINIRALSLADTADYGVMRMVADEPEAALTALKAAGFIASVAEVLAVSMADKPGAFHAIVQTLAEAGIPLEYSYAFVSPKGEGAFVVLRVQDNEKAQAVLEAKGFRSLYQHETGL